MTDILDYLLSATPAVIVLALVAWLAAPRKRGGTGRLTRFCLLLIWLPLLVLSLPPVADLLTAPLAGGAPAPDAANPPDLIIVPTAGVYRVDGDRWYPSTTSIARTATALEQQAAWPVPIVISGGNPDDGPPESRTIAEGMQLVIDDALMIETESRNTADTGANVAAIAEAFAVRHVLLVTSDSHMMRAAASLRHFGLEVSGVVAVAPQGPEGLLDGILPSRDALEASMVAIREYIGIVFYLVDGRIDMDDL